MTNAEVLRGLAEIGAIAPLDRHFALTLGVLGGENVALLAAVASAVRRRGHICLPLDDCAGRRLLDVLEWRPPSDDAGPAPEVLAPLAELRLPPLPALAAAAAASAVVAAGELTIAAAGQAPLVLDDGRLYLRRVFEAERAVADRLALAAQRQATASRAVDALIAQRFPAQTDRRAARLAADGRLCIVTGGPGTGKTTLSGRLLALLVEAGLAKTQRIALAAPTGRAAARLQQAVAAQLETVAATVPALADFQPRATTIHRLLQQAEGGQLALDALLVDECSMLDLGLMARLLGTLPAETRLILLGDAGQLASVQPGAVFSDLCAEAPDADVSARVVRLVTSHRFRQDSGIGRLAAAIAGGDGAAALEALAAPDETALQPLAGPAGFERLAAATAREDVAPLLRRWQQAAPLPPTSTLADRPPPFAPRRVLLARRTGPFGVERFNRLVARQLRAQGLAIEDDEFYPGRPIIVTRNDAATGLANGDTGVVVAAETAGEETGRQVWFPDLAGPDGALFLVAPGRLPAHESFFALTVHRAQGSEYEEVAFVPGQAESPVNTREMFYTAVTRARRKVVVYGGESTVTASIVRQTRRASGLAARLRPGRPATRTRGLGGEHRGDARVGNVRGGCTT